MSDYYNVVAGCLEASRNGRFCVGAEDAAVEIDALRKACGVKERELLELRGKLEASEHMLTIWRDAEAKRREGDHFEVRLDDDGALDEIVGSGAFHIEQMDTNSWFVEVGGWHAARGKGLVKAIGKNEVMPENVVVEFKFSV